MPDSALLQEGDQETDSLALLDVAAADFQDAIERSLIFPASFKTELDTAARTGDAPRADHILAHIRCTYEDDPSLSAFRSGFDGIGLSGRPIFGIEDLAWCTLRSQYGWGIPCKEAIEAVSVQARAAGGLIEVGAGTGYWAAVLSAHSGLPIDAYDDRSWRRDLWDSPWYPINQGNVIDAVRTRPDIPVLLVWTDPNGIGARVAEAMTSDQLLIHAGPAEHTGDDAFHHQLDTWFDILETTRDVSASGGEYPLYILRKRKDARDQPLSIFSKPASHPSRPS